MEQVGREHVTRSINWSDGGSISIVLYQKYLVVAYTAGNGTDKQAVQDSIYFTGVSNNYGGVDRIYFECPHCGRRSRFLYLHRRHFKCRKCASLNYVSQQLTKNEDLVSWKMLNILKNKFKIKESLAPMDAAYYKPERPKGMHKKTYLRLRIELYHLQEEYHRQFMKTAARIIRCLE